MASVSEVSGDWVGMFMITSESDSEAGSWGGDSNCSSLQEKSGGSGLLACFRWGVGLW